jgi:hypothetical protein
MAVSLYLYVAFLVSDFLESQIIDDEIATGSLRLTFGWILTFLLILTIFINLVYVIVSMSASLFRFLKNKVNNCKKRVTKHVENKEIKNNENKTY